MNTKGWLFSALGAWVAAVRMRATVSSSTSSGRNDRAARWVCTTSKKSGMGPDGIEQGPGPPRETDWAASGRPATFGAAPAEGRRPPWHTWSGFERRRGRQTVAEGAATHEDVLKSVIGQPTA